jgi:hypothetical protein
VGELVIDLYRKHYLDIRFERAGLFRAIKKKYNCSYALYPGSFVHITPSFFFPHVVYVDQDPTAKEFFADLESVLHYIDRNKQYKRSSYVRFIAQDYSAAMPLREGDFDLLISLYAGGISQACKKYLRIGGILLTNNHHDDAREAAIDDEFKLISIVKYRRDTYTVIEDNLNGLAVPRKVGRAKSDVRQVSNGIEYIENQDYYVFRRRPVR